MMTTLNLPLTVMLFIYKAFEILGYDTEAIKEMNVHFRDNYLELHWASVSSRLSSNAIIYAQFNPDENDKLWLNYFSMGGANAAIFYGGDWEIYDYPNAISVQKMYLMAELATSWGIYADAETAHKAKKEAVTNYVFR